MSTSIENISKKLPRILRDGTERTLYPELCPFIVAVAAEEPINLKGVEASAEESSTQHEAGVGFPDITVRHGKEITGWVEVKLPGKSLDHQDYVKQFLKYKNSLENVIFTNLQEWELWQWDRSDKENPKRMKRVSFDLTKVDSAENQKDFLGMLVSFFEYQPTLAKTPKQLALALARKTRLLSQQVEEAVLTAEQQEEKNNELLKLKNLFEKTLIQDLDVHQFANMVAETVAYSLFLARLEHEEKNKESDFTLTTANDYIPESIPILSDLYQLISKVSKEFPTIHSAALALLEQLNRTDIAKIRSKLTEHKIGEDPVIQFYEPFLKEFDPVERENRGVYYTPKPVVDFIVRGVDHLLRTKFEIADGLADETVHILDPATGTGTFLLSAIQEVNQTISKRNEGLGENVIQMEFKKILEEHILQHFYGFELLAAPYAIAHLKLTLESHKLGNIVSTNKSQDNHTTNRFKIYLANTLDNPEQPPKLDIPGYHIAEETNMANEVKTKKPIIVVLGNPPYSVSSLNKGKWIEQLMQTYKEDVRDERNIQILSDDYAKFIRFAHWRISKEKRGIVAMITKNTHIAVSAFKGMRKKLLEEFDEVYSYNLHGKLYEHGPNGETDESVFDIRVGTSITFLIKNGSKGGNYAKLFASDLFGDQNSKYEFLSTHTITQVQWKELPINLDHYFFEEKIFIDADSYQKYWKLTDLFVENLSGIKTGRDSLVIDSTKERLLDKLQKFVDSPSDENYLRTTFNLEDSTSLTILEVKNIIKKVNDGYIAEYSHKPFDNKYIYFDRRLIDRDRYKVMKSFLGKKNLGLILKKSFKENEYHYIFVGSSLIDINFLSGQSIVIPLYNYSDKEQTKLIIDEQQSDIGDSNFSELAKEFALQTKLKWQPLGKGDLISTLGPEAVFYFIYSILHSPIYRKTYLEQLKIGFPRIPHTNNTSLFKSLVEKGNHLVNLHLLGKNPFDISTTIFDDPKKWQVKILSKKSRGNDDWIVENVTYVENEKRVYINDTQYFEEIAPEVWEYKIGGYQVLEKWLKDRKKADRCLSVDDLKHYMKVVVSLRETIRIMKEIDEVIEEHGGWPIK